MNGPPSGSSTGAPASPQLSRIARLLGVDVADLAALDGLADVPQADLRVLHDQMSEAIHRGGRAGFAAVGTLASRLPGPVAARMAEKFLPPVLAARVCEHLDPVRARDLVTRVSLPYLAEVAAALDPVRSQAVVTAIPATRVGEVAAVLFGKGEHAAMAEFVGVIDADALAAALAAAAPHDLLAVVPHLEEDADVRDALLALPASQVEQILTELTDDEVAVLAQVLGTAGPGTPWWVR